MPRPTPIARRRPTLIATLALAALILPVPVAAGTVTAPGQECWVYNERTFAITADLAPAIAAAAPDDRLVVRGICTGNFTIAKDLRLLGIGTVALSRGVLSGGGSGTVLTIEAGSRVRLRNLRIEEGDGGAAGGGIVNRGTAFLRDVLVRRSTADAGGGILNEGTLALRGVSEVRRNTARVTGGGVENAPGATFVMRNDSKVNRNRAPRAGGIHNDAGTVRLRERALMRGNYATVDHGGGIFNEPGGSLILRNRSRITENRAEEAGGGIAGKVSNRLCDPDHVFANRPDDCYRVDTAG